MLQPSLPTYVCSLASPCAATTSTNIVPCVHSSTMLGSPVSNVLWSPGSANIAVMVTQGVGMSCSTQQSISDLVVPSSHVMPPVNRSRMCCEQPQPTLQSVLSVSASGAGIGSQQPMECVSSVSIEDLASRLVARLPAEVVKSPPESDSNRQRIEMLVETLIQGGNIEHVDADICNSPRFARTVEELASSRFEAERTGEAMGTKWRSQPGLLQQASQMQNNTSAFSSHQDYLQRKIDLSGCQSVVRSLGQLGQAAPGRQLEDQSTDLYRYAFCEKMDMYQLNYLPSLPNFSQQAVFVTNYEWLSFCTW